MEMTVLRDEMDFEAGRQGRWLVVVRDTNGVMISSHAKWDDQSVWLKGAGNREVDDAILIALLEAQVSMTKAIHAITKGV